MDFFDTLLFLGYSLIISVVLAVGLTAKSNPHRGNFSKAMFVSAVAGIIVPWATHFSYLYLIPAPSWPQIHTQLSSNLDHTTDPDPEAREEFEIASEIDPYAFGLLAIMITFPFIFWFPFKSVHHRH